MRMRSGEGRRCRSRTVGTRSRVHSVFSFTQFLVSFAIQAISVHLFAFSLCLASLARSIRAVSAGEDYGCSPGILASGCSLPLLSSRLLATISCDTSRSRARSQSFAIDFGDLLE